jgi:dienelactone hydrolase
LNPGKRKRRLLVLCLLPPVLAAGVFFTKRICDHRAVNLYRADWSAEASTHSKIDEGVFSLERISFEGVGGEQIPVLAALPDDGGGPWPAIIFLYGIGMKMEIEEEAGRAVADAGFALFVPEQYNRGERKRATTSRLREAFDLRRRASLTILEARRLADVIVKRRDVADDRIYLWGGSFGAIVGTAVLADDQRFKAGVLTLCGGNFPKLIANSGAREKLDLGQREIIGLHLMASLLRPFDPMHHVGKISPRPLLFQNATKDPVIPRDCVEDILEIAGEPKSILWYDAKHEDVERAIVEEAVQDCLKWLIQQDRAFRTREEPSHDQI